MKPLEYTISILNRLKEQDTKGEFLALDNFIRTVIPCIRVVKLPNHHPLRECGEYMTLDNRRLFCFRIALRELLHLKLQSDNAVDPAPAINLQIPVFVHDYEKMEDELRTKYTTVNRGGLPYVRGQKNMKKIKKKCEYRLDFDVDEKE